MPDNAPPPLEAATGATRKIWRKDEADVVTWLDEMLNGSGCSLPGTPNSDGTGKVHLCMPFANDEPYHVFGRAEKWVVIVIIGVAGLFSGLSSNIYFPALNEIAADLRVDLSAVSLTITSYMIVQGVAPCIWGSLSDTVGRRPIYLASFTVYVIANMILSYSPSLAVLIVFRGLQAAGSASTVSIGNGVIQDISPPAERGSFISFYQAIRNFSIAVGPVVGGALAGQLGFRSIFVFLLVLSIAVILSIVVFLPETLRSIAGNGSAQLHSIYQPLIRLIREPSYTRERPDLVRNRVTFATFLVPFKLLREKDVLCNLILGGVVYAIWSMVTSSTPGVLRENFQLNDVQIGLAFLPNGLGTIVGSAVVGGLMARDYKKTEAVYKAKHGLPDTNSIPPKSIPVDFELERARLGHLPWIAALFVLVTGVYGFTVSDPHLVTLPGFIAVPLVLQFLVAATSNAVFALNQTLVSDLCPGKGASATAANNLVRCTLGAIGVAGIEGMILALGSGGAFLVLASCVIGVSPLAALTWYWGQRWRAQRTQKPAALVSD